MTNCTIRQAIEDDLSALRPLWVDLYATEVASGMSQILRPDAVDVWVAETTRKLGSKTYLLLVAQETDGSLVGFHSLQLRRRPAIYKEPWVGSVIEIYVSPSHRGQQLARLMNKRGLEILVERGVRQVEVQTVPGNAASQGFWRSIGWTCDLIQYRHDLDQQP